MPAVLLPPGEAGQPGTLGLQIFLPGGPEDFEVRSNQAEEKTNKEYNDNFKKISRNAKCPCGSGRKFKHCHGKI